MTNKITIDDIIKRIKKLNFKNLNRWGVLGSAILGAFLGYTIHANRDFIYDVAQEYYEQSVEPTTQAEETVETEMPYTVEPQQESGLVEILSWNGENVGESKFIEEEDEPYIMPLLIEIMCPYPMVSVQEVQWKNNEKVLLEGMEAMLEDTCEENKEWEYIYSIRPEEDPEFDENYVIFYNPDVFTLLAEYQYPDENDYFVRPPFGGHFKVKQGNLDFVILSYHIKPDADLAYEELSHLNDVYNAVLLAFPDEEDVISVGDMNVGYLRSGVWPTLLEMTDYEEVLEENTSLAGQPHDKILIGSATLEDYTGNSGVYKFDLSSEVVEKLNEIGASGEDISDHYPIWIVLYTNRDTD